MQYRRWALGLSAVVACAVSSCTPQETGTGAGQESSSRAGSDTSATSPGGEQTTSSVPSGDTTSATPGADTAPAEEPTADGATHGAETTPGEETTSPNAPEQESEKPREITAVMNGDMLLHEGLWATSEMDAARTGRGRMDFRPLLKPMRPVLTKADLAICHLETPVAPPGGPYEGYPLFAAPPAILPALEWSGFDACTTASNHSIDQGFEGLTRTLAGLDAVGLAHSGTYATRADSRKPLIMEVDGVQVGLISQTYGTNGLPLPSEQPWSVPIIDAAQIKKMAAKARDDGVEIVMVALHWGLEYTHEPAPEQIAVAEQLVKSPDIDLIYGHHAHVVQPYDKVGGTWVIYGLGNAVAQQDTAVEGVYDGNTCRVTFTEKPDGSFKVSLLEYIPTMITRFDGTSPMRWLNVSTALRDRRYAGLRGLLVATHDRVTEAVNLEDALERGVVEGE